MTCPCEWWCGSNAPKRGRGDVAKVDLGEECGQREEGETHVGEVVLERLLAKKRSYREESWHVWVRTCGESGRCTRGARHEERTWLEKRTLLERRKADERRVDALQGSRDSFPVFFSFGIICK